MLTGIDSLAIERDPATGLAVQSSLGDVETAYEYDANGLLTATVATTSGEPVLGVRYSRDIMGRVTRVERTDSRGDARATDYAYDASGRLESVASDGNLDTYGYDESGNLMTVTRGDGGVLVTARFDDRDRLLAHGDRRLSLQRRWDAT